MRLPLARLSSAAMKREPSRGWNACTDWARIAISRVWWRRAWSSRFASTPRYGAPRPAKRCTRDSNTASRERGRVGARFTTLRAIARARVALAKSDTAAAAAALTEACVLARETRQSREWLEARVLQAFARMRTIPRSSRRCGVAEPCRGQRLRPAVRGRSGLMKLFAFSRHDIRAIVARRPLSSIASSAALGIAASAAPGLRERVAAPALPPRRRRRSSSCSPRECPTRRSRERRTPDRRPSNGTSRTCMRSWTPPTAGTRWNGHERWGCSPGPRRAGEKKPADRSAGS